MKRVNWACLAVVCVCLLVQMSAGAEIFLGENLIPEETVDDQSLNRSDYHTYNAEVKQWTPSAVNALDYNVNADMKEQVDSYGGHAYIWNDEQRELYVTDYGYAGFSTLSGATLNDILVWYGGSTLPFETDDFEFSSSSEAIQTADAFLKSFGITNAACLTVNSFNKKAAENKIAEMQAEGYEGTPSDVCDAYILSYAIKISGLTCDTELFTMANQRDIEGISITVIVNADGVIFMDFSGPYYMAMEVRPGTLSEVLSFDDIKEIVADKFDDLILSEPMRICSIKLQYVLLPVDKHHMAYTPCWCFATPRGSSGRYVWYRFNAYTGSEII